MRPVHLKMLHFGEKHLGPLQVVIEIVIGKMRTRKVNMDFGNQFKLYLLDSKLSD